MNMWFSQKTFKTSYVSIFLLALFPFILSAQEHARILTKNTTYNIRSNNDVDINESYSILILSKKGYHFAIFHDYFDQFKSIKSVSMTIRDASSNRKIKKIYKNDAKIIGFGASNEIVDSKMLYIDPAYHNYPFIVEVNVDIKMNGFISLPVWNPRPYFNLAVDKATLEVIIKNGLEVKIREDNIKLLSENNKENGDIEKKYEVYSLPHVDQNIRYKEFHDQQSKVYIYPLNFMLDKVSGSTATWKDFGDWFLKLNNDGYTLTEKTKNYIDNLPKDNTRKLISDIYYYMQNKTRYVSIQLGIGGFKSLPTEKVEAKNYGDCKALTTYMKNMLNYAGVNSNYILVHAGRDVPDVNIDFPGNQFNHVFLGVPLVQDTVLLECTSQLVPADYIGMFTDDRNVLWVDQNKSNIVRSRKYSHKNNLERNIAKIYLDDSGKGKIALKTHNSGLFYDKIMLYEYEKEDFIKQRNIENFSYKDFSISSFSFDQPDREASSFTTEFLIEVNGLGKKVGDMLILPANLLKPITDYVDYDKFLGYAELMRGITIKDSIEVNIANNHWISKLPEPLNLSTKYGNYKLIFKAEANKVIIKREFYFIKGKYTGAELDAFIKFIEEIEQQEKRKIILDSKT